MLKVIWYYFKLVLFLSFVLLVLGFSKARNNAKKVQEISVDFAKGDNLFLNAAMVNKLLIQNGRQVINQRKSALDLHSLEMAVEANEMVENAEISIGYDGVLRASVVQRVPIARVQDANSVFYLDRNGDVFPISKRHSSRVLLVKGDFSKKALEELYLLVKDIQSDVLLTKQIIGIQKEGDTYSLQTRVGNQKVLFGRYEDVAVKFKKLKSFYKKALKDNSLKRYSKINLQYKDQVICTKI